MPSHTDYDRQVRQLRVVPGTADAGFYLTPGATAPTNSEAGSFWNDSTAKTTKYYASTGYEVAGGRRPVKTAAATLTAADNTALCLFNAAAGFTYTLPPAELGLWFEFQVTVTVTSVAAKLITTTGDFLLGHFIQSTDGTYTTAAHAANGTDIVSWSGNGSTTGGLVGDYLKVTAISDSQWVIWGFGRATGAEATPFATS